MDAWFFDETFFAHFLNILPVCISSRIAAGVVLNVFCLGGSWYCDANCWNGALIEYAKVKTGHGLKEATRAKETHVANPVAEHPSCFPT